MCHVCEAGIKFNVGDRVKHYQYGEVEIKDVSTEYGTVRVDIPLEKGMLGPNDFEWCWPSDFETLNGKEI